MLALLRRFVRAAPSAAIVGLTFLVSKKDDRLRVLDGYSEWIQTNRYFPNLFTSLEELYGAAFAEKARTAIGLEIRIVQEVLRLKTTPRYWLSDPMDLFQKVKVPTHVR